jgi:hypothetical protein
MFLNSGLNFNCLFIGVRAIIKEEAASLSCRLLVLVVSAEECRPEGSRFDSPSDVLLMKTRKIPGWIPQQPLVSAGRVHGGSVVKTNSMGGTQVKTNSSRQHQDVKSGCSVDPRLKRIPWLATRLNNSHSLKNKRFL